MASGREKNPLAGLKDLRARIVAEERERTRARFGSGETASGPGPNAPEPPVASPPASPEADASSPAALLPSRAASPAEPPTPRPLETSAAAEPEPEAPTAAGPAPAPVPLPSGPATVGFRHEPYAPLPAAAATIPGASEVPVSPGPAGEPGEPTREQVPEVPPTEPWRSLVARHCSPEGWTEATLLPLVVERALASRQPAIRHGSSLLASADRFRCLSTVPSAGYLELRSDRGWFRLSPRAESPRLDSWRRQYELAGYPTAQARVLATRRMLHDLRESLKATADFQTGLWTKQISADDYLVQRHSLS